MHRLALLLVLLIATLPALAQDRRTDEHSYAQPDKVRISHLALDLAVDFDKRQLAGSATLTLAWADPAQRDFDRAFFPTGAATRERWVAISRARYADVGLPPVEL